MGAVDIFFEPDDADWKHLFRQHKVNDETSQYSNFLLFNWLTGTLRLNRNRFEILRPTDGQENWKEVFIDNDRGQYWRAVDLRAPDPHFAGFHNKYGEQANWKYRVCTFCRYDKSIVENLEALRESFVEVLFKRHPETSKILSGMLVFRPCSLLMSRKPADPAAGSSCPVPGLR